MKAKKEMGKHSRQDSQTRKLLSLGVALVLFSGFGVVFYKQMLANKGSADGGVAKKLNPAIERMIIEEVANGKAKESKNKKEDFTFYKTLKKDIKKPQLDVIAELSQKFHREDSLSGVVKKDDEKKEPEKTSPLNNDDSKARYTVQLASFEDFSKADGLTRTLKSKGYAPFIVAYNAEEATRYRVRMGAYKSRDEAITASRELNQTMHLNSIVVGE